MEKDMTKIKLWRKRWWSCFVKRIDVLDLFMKCQTDSLIWLGKIPVILKQVGMLCYNCCWHTHEHLTNPAQQHRRQTMLSSPTEQMLKSGYLSQQWLLLSFSLMLKHLIYFKHIKDLLIVGWYCACKRLVLEGRMKWYVRCRGKLFSWQ